MTGRLVGSGDIDAWHDALEQLSDTRESERMGEAAHQIWNRMYTPERNIEMIEASYGEAIQAGPES